MHPNQELTYSTEQYKVTPGYKTEVDGGKEESKETRQMKTGDGQTDIFCCKQCDKNFSSKGNLQRHLLQHQQEKQFSCELCNQKFARIDYLKDHRRVMHLNKRLCNTTRTSRWRQRTFKKEETSIVVENQMINTVGQNDSDLLRNEDDENHVTCEQRNSDLLQNKDSKESSKIIKAGVQKDSDLLQSKDDKCLNVNNIDICSVNDVKVRGGVIHSNFEDDDDDDVSENENYTSPDLPQDGMADQSFNAETNDRILDFNTTNTNSKMQKGKKSYVHKQMYKIQASKSKMNKETSKTKKQANKSKLSKILEEVKSGKRDHMETRQKKKSYLSGDNPSQMGTLKREYQCVECDKYFSSKSNLQRHQICHKKEKNFPCQQCNRQFARKDMLMDHVTIIHLNWKRLRYAGRTARWRKRSFKKGDKSRSVAEKNRMMNNGRQNNSDMLQNEDDESDVTGFDNTNDRVVNVGIVNDNFVNDGIVQNNFDDDDNESFLDVKLSGDVDQGELISASATADHVKQERRRSTRGMKMTFKAEQMNLNSTLFQCDICNRKFSTRDNLKSHIQTHRHIDELPCLQCGKKFATQLILEDHIKMIHRNSKQKRTKNSPRTRKKTAAFKDKMDFVSLMEEDISSICTKQDTVDDNQPSSECDMEVSEKKVYSCEICEFPFEEFVKYRDHILDKHHSVSALVSNIDEVGTEIIDEDLKTHTCIMCNIIFEDGDILGKHLKLKHNQGNYKLPLLVCETCGKEFRERYYLNQHRWSHSKDSKFVYCGVCLGKFKSKESIDTHDCNIYGVHNHNLQKPYPCKKCRLRFETSRQLHHHYRKHFKHDSSKVTCKVCHKTFSSSVYLKRHVLFSHARTSGLICDVCGKTFKKVGSLADHKRTHLANDDSCRCPLCNKVFTTDIGVKKHIKNIHTQNSQVDLENKVEQFDYSAVEYHMDLDLSIERKCSGDTFWVCTGIGDEVKVEDTRSEMVYCDLCGMKCMDEASVERHKQSFGMMNFHSCEECGKNFFKFDDYKLHMLIDHFPDSQKDVEGSQNRAAVENMDNNMFNCLLCDILFQSKRAYDKHMKLSHDMGNYKLHVLVCEFCGREFYKRNELNHHRTTHSENLFKNQCGICFGNFESKTALTLHDCDIDGTGSPITNPLSCRLCSASFVWSKKLHLHLRRHFMMKTNKFICKSCGKLFSSLQYLKRHVIAHTATNDYVCEICGKSFKRSDYLKDHRLLHQPKDGTFTCKDCGKVFKHKHYLKKHQLSMHEVNNRKTFKCEICGRQLRTIYTLRAHLLWHTELPKIECKKCRTKFKTEEELSEHIKKHEKGEVFLGVEKPFQCHECGKSFRRKDTLLGHQHVHKTPDGTHKCEICNKVFKHDKAVQRHMSFHSDEKPHVCDICGRRFKQLGNMRKHLFSHTDERPFKCDYCEKMFKSKEEARRHMKRHLVNSDNIVAAERFGKIYTCDQCGKKFASSGTLRAHVKVHTNERPYKCQYCDKAFKSASHVKRHEQSHFSDSRKSSLPKKQKEDLKYIDEIESSDLNYGNDNTDYDPVEQIVVEGVPTISENENMQAVEVIRSNTDGGHTIIVLPPGTYEKLHQLK